MGRRVSLALVLAAAVVVAGLWAPNAGARLLGTEGVLDYRQDSEPLNFAFPGDPTFGLPASEYRIVNLNCPQGTVATGGGASIPGAGGSTYLGRTVGESDWSAQAWQLATEPERDLFGFAICSELSKNRTELYRLRADRPLGASFVSLNCPGRKWHVTGGGVGPNDNRPEQGFIHSTFPIDGNDKGSKPDDGWGGWVHYPAGTVNRDVPVTALCQKREPKYRKKSKNLSAAELTSIKVRCKKREHVTGGGVSITGGTLDAHVISSYPVDGSDKVRVPDDGWKVVASSDNAVPKKFTAYAICAGKQGKP